MKLKIRPFLLSLLLFALIMQVVLQDTIGFFQYFDEATTVVCILYLVLDAFQHTKDKKNRVINLILILCLVIIGLIGNATAGIQKNYAGIIMDIGNIFKAYVAYLAFIAYFENPARLKTNYYTIRYLNTYCCVLVVPGAVLAVVNLFRDIGMHTDYIYGLRAFHYIFLRVGNLYTACILCLIVMTLCLIQLHGRARQRQLFFIGCTLLLMISTLRSRAILFGIVYVIGYLYFVAGKRLRIKMRYIIAVIILGLYIGMPKFQYYFYSSNAARSVLLRNGVKTAQTYFPIGAGFASYGTHAARMYWSPLYNTYSFNNYFGLSQEMGDFLTDGYWPAILGEFGILGTILVLILIIRIIIQVLKESRSSSIQRFAAVYGMAFMTASSLVTGSFFAVTAVSTMALIAIAVKYKPLQEMAPDTFQNTVNERGKNQNGVRENYSFHTNV